MSSHKTKIQMRNQDNLDWIIRWTLQSSVADAKPSPQAWQRIEQNISKEQKNALAKAYLLDKVLTFGAWLGRLIENNTTPHTYSGHRGVKQIYAVDMWAPLSIVSIIEGRMLGLRVVS